MYAILVSLNRIFKKIINNSTYFYNKKNFGNIIKYLNIINCFLVFK